MKHVLFAFLLTSVAAASEIRAFMWQESRAEKTGEHEFSFFLAHETIKRAAEADARGDEAEAQRLGGKIPPDSWWFGVMLRGVASSYAKDKITLMRLDGHEIVDVVSGTVDVDFKKRIVRVSIEVMLSGKRVVFTGNGIYAFTDAPKK